jgi:hypothetical protein
MNAKLPPVPPENRSDKGTGEPETVQPAEARGLTSAKDPDKQGHQGNTKVNTTHQGYQQDR